MRKKVTRPAKKARGEDSMLRVLFVIEFVGGIVDVFPNSVHTDYIFIQAHLLMPHAYTGKSWAGVKVQQSNQFSPREDPRMVLCLPPESILENCHLSFPCCWSSTCHLPLKFLEVLLGLLIRCHMVTSRITF